jgi:hypothetical protein
MKGDAVARDCWIAGQLAGIRMLERESAQDLACSGAGAHEGLGQRVAQLNSWLNPVERALTVNTDAVRPASRLRGRVVTFPGCKSSGRLPAA